MTKHAWELVHTIIRLKLESQQSHIVIDSTSVLRRDRVNLVKFLRSHMSSHSQIVGLVFAPTLETTLKQNQQRENVVPEEYIRNKLQALKSHPPSYEEGFDKLLIVNNDLGLRIEVPDGL